MAAPPPALPGELVEEILLRLPPDDPRLPPPRLPRLQGPGQQRLRPRLPPPPPRAPRGTLRARPPPRQAQRALHPHHRLSLLPRHPGSPLQAAATDPWTGATVVPYSSRTPRNSSCGSQSRAPSGAYLCLRRSSAATRLRPCSARRMGATIATASGGPFRVLFVFSSDDHDDDGFATSLSACLYSSETRAWGS
ncbi:hypothetical protein ACQJBY_040540 [Aegilops geniculata]